MSAEAFQKAKDKAEATACKQLEAIVADNSKSNDQRERAKKVIEAQHAEMETIAKQAEETAKYVSVICFPTRVSTGECLGSRLRVMASDSHYRHQITCPS